MRWSDKKVKEFCKIYTRRWDYREYENCGTIDEKLKKFKELNKIRS